MKRTSGPFPVLKTERLVLRETDFSDVEEVYFLRSDSVVNKHLGGSRCADLDAAKAHIEMIQNQFASGKTYSWSICIGTSKKMIGSICLWNISLEKNKAEVGYALHPNYQNNGYMQESMKAVLDFGFILQKFSIIDAYTNKDNLESIKLLLKNGFELNQNERDDKFPDNRIYVLSSENWLQKSNIK